MHCGMRGATGTREFVGMRPLALVHVVAVRMLMHVLAWDVVDTVLDLDACGLESAHQHTHAFGTTPESS